MMPAADRSGPPKASDGGADNRLGGRGVPAPNEHPEQAVTAQPERAGLRHRHSNRDIQARVVSRPLVLHFQFPAVFGAGAEDRHHAIGPAFPDRGQRRAAGDQLVRRKAPVA